MNNTEANGALAAKNAEISALFQPIVDAMEHLLEYEREMGNWKASIITAKIAEIKTEATAGGVDLSTWDGSAA